MTKAERKLLQQREAALFLELQQMVDWFGKDDCLIKMVRQVWSECYEILELLDVEVDLSLPANVEARDLLSARVKKEEQEKELINQ